MLNHLDQFYESLPEPNKSCLLVLRKFILEFDEHISEAWKWRLPYFMYKKKGLCYFWKDKKTQQPYIGIIKGMEIDHPLLIQGDRTKMKVLYIDPEADLPLELIGEILSKALTHYK